MAWTQTDIDKLKTAIASGVMRVDYENTRVHYQTTDDMLKALRRMESELAEGAMGKGTGRTILVQHGRGL